MAFTTDDLLESLRFSRQQFGKHLQGVREDQLDWKPYPECKSIRETLVHLMQDDLASLRSLETGGEPDYGGVEREVDARIQGKDWAGLLDALEGTHAALLGFIRERHAADPLDTDVSLWGMPMKLGRALAYLSSEDYYHAGQVAFIRMATDPSWDYYGAVYGAG